MTAARHRLLRDDSLLQDKGRIGPLFQRWVQDPDRDSAMAATAKYGLRVVLLTKAQLSYCTPKSYGTSTASKDLGPK